jgi:PDZ domain-containing protein
VSQPTPDVLPGAGPPDGGPGGPGPARRRHPSTRPGLLPAALLTATFLAIAVAAALTFVGLPYVVMSPGPATNILGKVDGKPLLSITGAPTYPTSGTLDFTTVSVDGGPGVRVTVYDLAQAWLGGSQEILPEAQVFPPEQSEQDAQEEGAAEMAGSQSVATAIALRGVGKTVDEMVVIASVPDDSPSKDVFSADDVLVKVDGDPASSSDAVRAAVQRHEPGDSFPVVVRRDGKEQTVTARTTESDGRTVMGVNLRLDYELPVDVTLRTGSVGGPSAGLMFSLAIYDALTPGELTGGKRIAGTGTMDDDGTVGPIGGIRQKLLGARRAGADFFLAPADNCAEVKGNVPDGLRVVRVATFDDGVAAVRDIGTGKAASLPTCG